MEKERAHPALAHWDMMHAQTHYLEQKAKEFLSSHAKAHAKVSDNERTYEVR
jgi:hypothetical protein